MLIPRILFGRLAGIFFIWDDSFLIGIGGSLTFPDPEKIRLLLICHRATSATSHVVLGQFKTCVILLGGYILFDSNPGMSSICGAITALSGMSLYMYLNLFGSHQRATKAAPQQSSFSSRKSKLSKEGSNPHEENCTTETV